MSFPYRQSVLEHLRRAMESAASVAANTRDEYARRQALYWRDAFAGQIARLEERWREV